ncbi:MAG: MarR family transcriptional regulator [Paracoccaceae bacterium]|nr:MAG: MarR family transcriptional regulator [Paracoccaceae bacterium]
MTLQAHGTARGRAPRSGEELLFLTDDQLRQGIELMFFAYQAFTSDADRILEGQGLGRAHHRALHFIGRCPGLTVAQLIDILGVTKQSLNRVLRQLVDRDLVESRVGATDRRQRNLFLTPAGIALERQLSEAQRERVRRAWRDAGSEAVAGFRRVLEGMMDPDKRARVRALMAPPGTGG